MKHCLVFSLLVCAGVWPAWTELRVPASTAYLEGSAQGAEVGQAGISKWENPGTKVVWWGEFKKAGALRAAVTMQLPAGQSSRLRLSFSGQMREATAVGAGGEVTASFGEFRLADSGYQSLTLESLNPFGQAAGEITSLLLEGPAAEEAHFNLLPRRNAASVHLMYPQPPGAKISAFSCEVTAVEDPVATYYMACGWHRGYFGMQVNSATERRIIFSVWDSGQEGKDRQKVGNEDRVTLIAKGKGVQSGDFGNEGTGGHSHLVYPWKTGERQRFLVTGEPVDGTHTVYAGYYFHPEKKEWMLISSWRAPKDGSWLRGLYSFNENFGGENGQLRRKALFGNQWLRTAGGEWQEVTEASFGHDATGKADRLDRFMGLEAGQFFLSNGGFVPGFTPYGEKFQRPAGGQPPVDFAPPNP